MHHQNKKMKHTLTIAFVCLLVGTACTKKSSTANTTPKNDSTTFEFYNQLDTICFFDIYRSLSDYSNNANVMMTIKVSSYEQKTVKVANSPLYIDEHTSNYQITNWSYQRYIDTSNNTVFSDPIKITSYRSGFGTPDYMFQMPNNDRAILLNNTQISTKWKVIDAFQYVNYTWISVWNTLNTNQKNMSIVFNKNFTTTFVDSSGIPKELMFTHDGYPGNLSGNFIKRNDSNTRFVPAEGYFYNANADWVISDSAGIPQWNMLAIPPFTNSTDTIGFSYYGQYSTRYIFLKQ